MSGRPAVDWRDRLKCGVLLVVLLLLLGSACTYLATALAPEQLAPPRLLPDTEPCLALPSSARAQCVQRVERAFAEADSACAPYLSALGRYCT